MCGFAGFLAAVGGVNRTEAHDVLRQMGKAIEYRGPDSDGYWVDPDAGIGLAHRRLAIVDLTPAGAQPMVSGSGRYVLAFNGEIYNHDRLRTALAAEGKVFAPWRGHSDTETLLAGIEGWGLRHMLSKTIGMFAIALWDRQLRTLTLVRDRFGEKPLYFGWQGTGEGAAFLFGSELSALRRHPAFASEIDRNAISSLLRHNNIGGIESIYIGIRKVLPGQLITVSSTAPLPAQQSWWSTADTIVRSKEKPFTGTPEDAVDALDALLKDAVGQQMMADVPLGAFLSGGIDSSAVVSLMQAQSSRPVRTFSIGFHEAGYNEAEHAKAVAKQLGTNHTELYVSPEKALSVIPTLPTLYSEPFADSSQIPTFLVSKLAREQVTVSLSGDAGDELFCGYTRYQMTANLWDKIKLLPQPLRALAGKMIAAARPERLERLLQRTVPLAHLGHKLHKAASVLDSRTAAELYRSIVTHWFDPAEVVLGASDSPTDLIGEAEDLSSLNDVERMMALDMLNYLPDDILVKVDRAAMAVSLETRVPMLDHRVVEFSCSLPLNYKLRGAVTKWPLRQVLYRYVPRELVERPKMGFGVPIDVWLRGPLRGWAEDLLAEARLRNEGYLRAEPIRRKWAEHLSGRRNWQSHLWDVLMFQAWLEAQRG